jgi:hypothetical protein
LRDVLVRGADRQTHGVALPWRLSLEYIAIELDTLIFNGIVEFWSGLGFMNKVAVIFTIGIKCGVAVSALKFCLPWCLLIDL